MVFTIKARTTQIMDQQQTNPSLNIKILGRTNGVASFAQRRLSFNDHCYGNMPASFPYCNFVVPLLVKKGSISVARIRTTIIGILKRYEVFRTAIHYNSDNDQLEQDVQMIINDNSYSFEVTYGIQSQDQIETLLVAEASVNYFDIEHGVTFRCHLIKKNPLEPEFLCTDDIIIFTIHSIAFDLNSVPSLLEVFSRMYGMETFDDSQVQYLDFALHEHDLLYDLNQDSIMNQARRFWTTMMDGYDWNKKFSFPKMLESKSNIGSDNESRIAFFVSSSVIDAQKKLALMNDLTMFELSLAYYFIFLYKLSQNTIDDICVLIPTYNRLFSETKSMIGMLDNIIPYRIKIDSSKSLIDLAKEIRQLRENVLKNACFPYQEIIKNENIECSAKMIPLLFQYQADLSSMVNKFPMKDQKEDAELSFYLNQNVSYEIDTILSDLSLTIIHDKEMKIIRCVLKSTTHFYDQPTLFTMTQYLQFIMSELFDSCSTVNQLDQVYEPIFKLSLVIQETVEDKKPAVFRRLSNTILTGPASYAQHWIWSKEMKRSLANVSQVGIHNMPFLYRITYGSILKIPQIFRALQHVIEKHSLLRTSYSFNDKENILMQRIIQPNKDQLLFTFIESTVEREQDFINLMNDEQSNSNHFDLSRGLVFRCHIVRRSSVTCNDTLNEGDFFIFNFHQICFDRPSIDIFYQDFKDAYLLDGLTDDDTIPRFIDYAIIERKLSMTTAYKFWHDALNDFDIDRPISLPFNQRRVHGEHRTGNATSVSFDFGDDLSQRIILCASKSMTTVQNMMLAVYYVFLFKLSNGECDLCVGMKINGRYKSELNSLIGIFINTIPLRCKIDCYASFGQLIEYICTMTTQCMPHCHLPIQRILEKYSKTLEASFLDTTFEFNASKTMKKDDQMIEKHFPIVPILSWDLLAIKNVVCESDFSLRIHYDTIKGRLSCTLNASLDVFQIVTIEKLAQRFLIVLQQLFDIRLRWDTQNICNLSLILPDEERLFHSINNTEMLFPSQGCAHQEFALRAYEHSQKVAAELDEQTLTYGELLNYVHLLAHHLLVNYNFKPGNIVCQCVERSLSMVIGIMAIEMAGGAYCPLTPRDPLQRLYSLVEQTRTSVVFIHWKTFHLFAEKYPTLDIDRIVNSGCIVNSIDIEHLSKLNITPKSTIYVVFTSGSTGIPKAVQMRHEHFTKCAQSLVHVDIFGKNDVIIQMARSSFDVHFGDIVGALIVGASLVMLHPQGNMDFQYLSQIIQTKQVSFMNSVPSLLSSFIRFLKENELLSATETLRSICYAGEALTVKAVKFFVNDIGKQCRLWNWYGQSETNLGATYHLIDLISDTKNISIGRPLPNYECLILDDFLQIVPFGQEGELVIRGVGVFLGYLDHEDVTAKALIDIDGQMFYRTGDLARWDNHGLLHYMSRKDHQVKLRGQRIELGEIEQCLLDTSISVCVVIKWGVDHLIAYIQSSNVNVDSLRAHCRSRLPSFMVPSIFIVLEKLPLSANGKIDRKRLPSPDFSNVSSSQNTNTCEMSTFHDGIKTIIHTLWCEIFDRAQISTNISIFTIGGHSLIIMQIHYRYQILFGLERNSVSISDLFERPTITDHVLLVREALNTKRNFRESWCSLHIHQAEASLGQQRLLLKEQNHFSCQNRNVIYAMPFLFRVASLSNYISITRFHHALRFVIMKHAALRTAIDINDNGFIMQRCLNLSSNIDEVKPYGFSIIDLHHNTNDDIYNTVREIMSHRDLFDLKKGRVILCHILRQQRSVVNKVDANDDALLEDDFILFNIHHAAFDRVSFSLFFGDLLNSYETHCKLPVDDDTLQYIDYSVHERLMDMSVSRDFWQRQLQGCDLRRSLSLPTDRQLALCEQRSGCASTAQITFNDDFCTLLFNYISEHSYTPFQVVLAMFYVFLFKLTQGQTDLCLTCIDANRYRIELMNLVGMYFAEVPYSILLDPDWSFDDVIKHVRNMHLSIVEHSHYPLQCILDDHNLNLMNSPFLETVINFITISSNNDDLYLNDAVLKKLSVEQSFEIADADFGLTVLYNPTLPDGKLVCRFVCSHDLFDETTVESIAQRFEQLAFQFFSSKDLNFCENIQSTIPIKKLSITLPNESQEIPAAIVVTLSDCSNEVTYEENKNDEKLTDKH